MDNVFTLVFNENNHPKFIKIKIYKQEKKKDLEVWIL